MPRYPLSLLAASVFSLSATPTIAASDPHVRDLLILTDWFEGEFDNEEQLWFEGYPGMLAEDKEPHGRLHAMHRRIEFPEFGEHVFYVEDYVDADPGKVMRQRVVSFVSDPANGGIRMKLAFLRDAAKYVGGYHNPSLLDGLTNEDIFRIQDSDPNSDCDVIFRRNGEQFNGSMMSRRCVFGEGEDRRYSIHNIVLSQDSYTRADLTRRLSDNSIKAGHPEDQPHIMKRALPFTCSGRFFSNPSATNDAASTSVQRFDGMRLHSQGGTFQVERETDGQGFEVLMRTKNYPFYTERPDFLYFSVREAGATLSTVYSVNDINSRQMGVTIPGLSVYCYRNGYKFDESLEMLDKSAP